MLGFWEALESAAETQSAPLETTQARLHDQRAIDEARAFHAEMLRDRVRLSALGIDVTLLDRTVSFRRNGYGVQSVHFGIGGADVNRIVSAVATHLNREPSYEDVPWTKDIGAPAGRWLGRSMDLIARNPDVFARFGLV